MCLYCRSAGCSVKGIGTTSPCAIVHINAELPREDVMSGDKAEARRYDRVAWRYDFLESPREKMFFSKLRKA